MGKLKTSQNQLTLTIDNDKKNIECLQNKIISERNANWNWFLHHSKVICEEKNKCEEKALEVFQVSNWLNFYLAYFPFDCEKS